MISRSRIIIIVSLFLVCLAIALGIVMHNRETRGTASVGLEDAEAYAMALEKEKADPSAFLTINCHLQRNFWESEYKIKAEVNNLATIVHYKDITVEVTYKTGSGHELIKQEIVLEDMVDAGTSASFSLDITHPSSAGNISAKVVRATPYVRTFGWRN